MQFTIFADGDFLFVQDSLPLGLGSSAIAERCLSLVEEAALNNHCICTQKRYVHKLQVSEPRRSHTGVQVKCCFKLLIVEAHLALLLSGSCRHPLRNASTFNLKLDWRCPFCTHALLCLFLILCFNHGYGGHRQGHQCEGPGIADGEGACRAASSAEGYPNVDQTFLNRSISFEDQD